jgi:hypothetical protein
MRDGRQELTLEEFLADPLILAVMKADRVDPKALAIDLRRVADEIEWEYVMPSPSVQECSVTN